MEYVLCGPRSCRRNELTNVLFVTSMAINACDLVNLDVKLLSFVSFFLKVMLAGRTNVSECDCTIVTSRSFCLVLPALFSPHCVKRVNNFIVVNMPDAMHIASHHKMSINGLNLYEVHEYVKFGGSVVESFGSCSLESHNVTSPRMGYACLP